MKLLDGVKVLDLGSYITAPYCGMLLAELGADVVKIEEPKHGDPFRSFRGGLYSPQFVAFNKHKRSVALDLRTEDGRATLLDLADNADALLENFRPGVADRLGLTWDVLHQRNPRLIFCSITGFGTIGPYRNRPAYDTVANALSGLLSLFVDPDNPVLTGPTMSDNVTGLLACTGVVGALYERTRTNLGRRVEVNMLEALISFIPEAFTALHQTGKASGPLTRVAASQCWVLRCADGKSVAIHLSSPEKFWQSFTVALERPDLADDPRFATRISRIDNYGALTAELSAIVTTRPRSYWVARLDTHEVPYAPVHTIDAVTDDPQVQALGTFYRATHPVEGETLSVRRPIYVDGSRAVDDRAPPALGQHNDEILGPGSDWLTR